MYMCICMYVCMYVLFGRISFPFRSPQSIE